MYSLLLHAFPEPHRQRYAREMLQAFEEELEASLRTHDAARALRFALAAYVDVIGAGAEERRRMRRMDGGGSWRSGVEGLLRDIVYASRSLLKARMFSVVCVLSLAVGIGSNVGVVVFFRAIKTPPELVDAKGLVELIVEPVGPARTEMEGRPSELWSYPDFVDVRDAGTGMRVTAWSQGSAVLRMKEAQGSASIRTLYVADDYFTLIGVAPILGRGFNPADADPAAPKVAIVGYDLWQNRLGGQPDLVGSALTINGAEHTVIGVAPESFQGHRTGEGGDPADLWLPLQEHPVVASTVEDVRLDRRERWINLLGKLPVGMTLEQANAALSTRMAQLESTYPATNEDKGAEAFEFSAIPALMRGEFRIVEGMLFSASGIVLLIVCLNIAGMVLVRTASRERELAVRVAVGSSRAQLVKTMLAESLVLSLASGFVAVIGVFGGIRFIAWRMGARLPEVLEPDLGMFALCTLFSLVATLGVGLWPALRHSRPGMFTTLRGDAAGTGRRVGRMHRLAAAAQAALALPFLVVGGIYLDRARTALFDLGFEPEALLAVPLDLTSAGYPKDEADAFLRRIREDVRGRRDVTSTSLATGLPLDFERSMARVSLPNDPERVSVQTTRVSEGYFTTIGTQILAGRDIAPEDRAGAEPVVVITRALSDILWPDGNALGRRLAIALDGKEEQLRVVGIVENVAAAQVADEREAVFVSLAQYPTDPVYVVLRATSEPEGMVAALQDMVTTLDPDLIRPDVVTGTRLIDRTVGDLLTASIISGIFAVIALLLAALGVYGIIAFMVAARTREIGVRMAMGASRKRVLREVSRDGVKLVLPGLVIGSLFVWAFLKFKTDIPTTTPVMMAAAFGLAFVTAIAIAMLASLGPAFRASSVQPVEAMRPE